MDMHDDDSMDELMREARRSYNAPDEPAPDQMVRIDRMWARIDTDVFGPSAGGGDASRFRPTLSPAMQSRAHGISWQKMAVGIAAALVIGIGLGRVSSGIERAARGAGEASELGVASAAEAPVVAEPYTRATSQYLGQTAALLSALPVAETHGPASDARFVSQASDLLTTTRVLLDSPASDNPRLKSLLEDLELVLAQIARLPSGRDTTELELIRKALEQRDVVPRLRSVAADLVSSDN
jgi:hypothetical protein